MFLLDFGLSARWLEEVWEAGGDSEDGGLEVSGEASAEDEAGDGVSRVAGQCRQLVRASACVCV